MAGAYLSFGVSSDIQVGDLVMVDTDALNIRDDVGLDATVLDTLTYGFTASVIARPGLRRRLHLDRDFHLGHHRLGRWGVFDGAIAVRVSCFFVDIWPRADARGHLFQSDLNK